MAKFRTEETATPNTTGLNDAQLLGFEWLEAERAGEAATKQAIGVAFNKRGFSGEGPPKFKEGEGVPGFAGSNDGEGPEMFRPGEGPDTRV